MPVLTPEEYSKRAGQMVDPGYAIKVANANNGFNDALNQYNAQATQIGNAYDANVKQIQTNTATTQNQYANNNLSRGLARSTIASTGIASIANQGTQLQAEAAQARDQQISQLEQLKNTLRGNLNSTLAALESERQGNINSMAMQLMQRDQDVQMQLDRDAESKREFDANLGFQQSQAAASQAWQQKQFDFQQSQATLDQQWKEKQFVYQQQQDELNRQIEAAKTVEEQRRYEQQLRDSQAAAAQEQARYEQQRSDAETKAKQDQANFDAQMAESKRQFDATYSLNQQKAAATASKSSGSGSGGTKSSSQKTATYNNALADVQYLMQVRGDANTYIRNNKVSWLQQGLTAAQIKSIQDYVDNYTYTYQENRRYTSSSPVTAGL